MRRPRARAGPGRVGASSFGYNEQHCFHGFCGLVWARFCLGRNPGCYRPLQSSFGAEDLFSSGV